MPVRLDKIDVRTQEGVTQAVAKEGAYVQGGWIAESLIELIANQCPAEWRSGPARPFELRVPGLWWSSTPPHESSARAMQVLRGLVGPAERPTGSLCGDLNLASNDLDDDFLSFLVDEVLRLPRAV